MKEMPDNSVDLVLTDPPYGIGNTQLSWDTLHKKKDWNDKIPCDEIFDEIYRISKNQIIWGANYYGANIKNCGRIVHYKRRSFKEKVKVSECDLASQSYDKRIRFFDYAWNGNYQGNRINWNNDGPDARIHPTQKPIALMAWCLNEYTTENQLIFDPFSGSGTTAIACDTLKRRFICVEKDPDYHKASIKRLEQHQAQITMF